MTSFIGFGHGMDLLRNQFQSEVFFKSMHWISPDCESVNEKNET